jgi:hypothetical protein
MTDRRHLFLTAIITTLVCGIAIYVAFFYLAI